MWVSHLFFYLVIVSASVVQLYSNTFRAFIKKIRIVIYVLPTKMENVIISQIKKSWLTLNNYRLLHYYQPKFTKFYSSKKLIIVYKLETLMNYLRGIEWTNNCTALFRILHVNKSIPTTCLTSINVLKNICSVNNNVH